MMIRAICCPLTGAAAEINLHWSCVASEMTFRRVSAILWKCDY